MPRIEESAPARSASCSSPMRRDASARSAGVPAPSPRIDPPRGLPRRLSDMGRRGRDDPGTAHLGVRRGRLGAARVRGPRAVGPRSRRIHHAFDWPTHCAISRWTSSTASSKPTAFSSSGWSWRTRRHPPHPARAGCCFGDGCGRGALAHALRRGLGLRVDGGGRAAPTAGAKVLESYGVVQPPSPALPVLPPLAGRTFGRACRCGARRRPRLGGWGEAAIQRRPTAPAGGEGARRPPASRRRLRPRRRRDLRDAHQYWAWSMRGRAALTHRLHRFVHDRVVHDGRRRATPSSTTGRRRSSTSTWRG